MLRKLMVLGAALATIAAAPAGDAWTRFAPAGEPMSIETPIALKQDRDDAGTAAQASFRAWSGMAPDGLAYTLIAEDSSTIRGAEGATSQRLVDTAMNAFPPASSGLRRT